MTNFVAWPLGTIDRNSPFTGLNRETPVGTSLEEIRRDRDDNLFERTRSQVIAPRHYAAVGKDLDVSETGGVTLTNPSEIRSTDLYPASGYVKIGSEIIGYTGKTGGTQDNGHLSGLTRGAFSTTPATHLEGAIVYTYHTPDLTKIPYVSLAAYPAASNLVAGTVGGNGGIRVSQLDHWGPVAGELLFNSANRNREQVIKTNYDPTKDGYPLVSFEVLEESLEIPPAGVEHYFALRYLPDPDFWTILVHVDLVLPDPVGDSDYLRLGVTGFLWRFIE